VEILDVEVLVKFPFSWNRGFVQGGDLIQVWVDAVFSARCKVDPPISKMGSDHFFFLTFMFHIFFPSLNVNPKIRMKQKKTDGA
jgi:hypothetical protein